MVEVSPRRVFANAHTYHVNSISVNSDYETYMSADDLRINLWHLDITDRSFSILHVFYRQVMNNQKYEGKSKDRDENAQTNKETEECCYDSHTHTHTLHFVV